MMTEQYWQSVTSKQTVVNTRTIALYEDIAHFVADNGYPPSRREISRMLGLPKFGAAMVHNYLQRLTDWGWIQAEPFNKRGIRLMRPLECAVDIRTVVIHSHEQEDINI